MEYQTDLMLLNFLIYLKSNPYWYSFTGQPGVVSVFLSQSYKVQTTASWLYLGFMTFAGIWPAANFGENSIVGMLDTGNSQHVL